MQEIVAANARIRELEADLMQVGSATHDDACRIAELEAALSTARIEIEGLKSVITGLDERSKTYEHDTHVLRAQLATAREALSASHSFDADLKDTVRLARAALRIMREALEKIARNSDCGCTPVCRCSSQEHLAIWKEEAQEEARAALAQITAPES